MTKRPEGLRWKIVFSSKYFSGITGLMTFANLSEASTELGSQNVAQRHQFRGLVSGIAKHMALITSTNLFRSLGEMTMYTLGYIRTLLLNVN
ncbi:hypothetical protein OIU78_006773 [Salix suchowensis]|nr:hypothetical protein OIU78_006773 [Salix suchowensis]